MGMGTMKRRAGRTWGGGSEGEGEGKGKVMGRTRTRTMMEERHYQEETP